MYLTKVWLRWLLSLSTSCFIKDFTNLKTYRNLFRWHIESVEVSFWKKTHWSLTPIVLYSVTRTATTITVKNGYFHWSWTKLVFLLSYWFHKINSRKKFKKMFVPSMVRILKFSLGIQILLRRVVLYDKKLPGGAYRETSIPHTTVWHVYQDLHMKPY